MCCENGELEAVAEVLAETRAAPVEGDAAKPLEFRYGPAFVKNPLTGALDIPVVKHLRQIFVKGMRIGYVNVNPGGPISLLRPWESGQIDVIREAVLEELAISNFDVETPRKFNVPQHDGLLDLEKDDEPAESTIIIPE